MQPSKFIYQIQTEPHYNILVRILARFARSRVKIEALQAGQVAEEPQRISILVSDTKDNVIKMSRVIDKEIDVLSVTLFEQTF
ncbi:MAG: hypothetical protein ABI581_01555 [Sediminibacterium sp.]